MKSYEMIEWEMEDLWAESAERKYLPISFQGLEYECVRDSYKAQRIYMMYGYDMFVKFVTDRPHIAHLLDEYVPCKQEAGAQCSLYCHKYNKEKGCMLNAAE